MRGLLFDVGGTKMRVAVVSRRSDAKRAIIVPTPKRFTDGIRTIRTLADRMSGGGSVDIVVGGLAGTLSRSRETLINSPHLAPWVRKPIRQALARAIHAPVVLENDCDLIGLGEAVSGAGKGYRIVAYITVSTGVGGTRIVDRRLDTVAYGFEPGHMVIDPNGPSYHTLRVRGVLESMVSGTAVTAAYHRPPYTITLPKVWRQQATLLAYGLVNVTVMWSPDVIILGGSMFKTPGISVTDVRRELAANLRGFLPSPVVLRGALGDIGGIYGAYHLAKTLTR